MAEINKLSVGRALDKLRATDGPQTKMAQLEGKIGELDSEIHRLRAVRGRVERDQRAGSTPRGPTNLDRHLSTRKTTVGLIVGMAFVIMILISIWLWAGF
jgi:hypothetical protein